MARNGPLYEFKRSWFNQIDAIFKFKKEIIPLNMAFPKTRFIITPLTFDIFVSVFLSLRPWKHEKTLTSPK